MRRERFYELGQFFGGYFHQDWRLEAKDWQSAVQSFLEGNSPERIKAVTTQFGVLLSMHIDDEHLGNALRELGNAHSPLPEMSYRAWLYGIHDLLKEAVRRMR